MDESDIQALERIRDGLEAAMEGVGEANATESDAFRQVAEANTEVSLLLRKAQTQVAAAYGTPAELVNPELLDEGMTGEEWDDPWADQ